MKKLLTIGIGICIAMSVTAGPCGGRGCGPCGPCGPRPGWCGPGPGWCHGGWGRGGCNFWPSFAGAAVGTLVGNIVSAPATTVVTTPVVTTPVVTTPVVTTPVVTTPVVTTPVVSAPVYTQPRVQVWVEGRYVDQVRADGVVVRIWQGGHYEYR